LSNVIWTFYIFHPKNSCRQASLIGYKDRMLLLLLSMKRTAAYQQIHTIPAERT